MQVYFTALGGGGVAQWMMSCHKTDCVHLTFQKVNESFRKTMHNYKSLGEMVKSIFVTVITKKIAMYRKALVFICYHRCHCVSERGYYIYFICEMGRTESETALIKFTPRWQSYFFGMGLIHYSGMRKGRVFQKKLLTSI